MDILKSLGVDGTLWIQLCCFLVSYIAISELVLKPYMAALREREQRTIGSEEAAARLIEEAEELHTDFEKKARAINFQIKGIYDLSRTEAMKEYDEQVAKARNEVEQLLESSRVQISEQIRLAEASLLSEVSTLSSALASKLAGKEIKI
jgi:F0F1-type ATP synthase membrane subunit b/b'